MFVEGGLHPEQVKALRKMSLDRRAAIALGFLRSMRQLKLSVLRNEHPNWTDEQINAALRRSVSHGGD
jgi:ribosomal protein L31